MKYSYLGHILNILSASCVSWLVLSSELSGSLLFSFYYSFFTLTGEK